MPRQNAALVTAFDDEDSPERGIVHAVAARPAPDREQAIAAVAQLLQALGRDPDAPHLADTPRRVADALIEMLTPSEFTATTFENEAGYDSLVLVCDIPFTSLCEHHLLPFHGTAHIGYLPGERIIGLSKLARILEYFSRALQVQERLTQQVADWLQEELGARGVGVVLQAEHQCMAARGVRVSGTRTTTSAWHGELRSDRAARAEFLTLSGIGAALEEGN
ncbi:GTP cyclohydrolase I FolE [Microterricola viridarii]|uniref:GTP cyclohydrolase 1 n=1 Tax=Microterricola viridarii TaxID=412690 RepID=A0A1H1YKL1_9MICO|nr:GTP cyclohydrolase I FolE [Microterricola viridarii]SDT21596.1 GTP cyclohydrolase I [Microterricola viridarii]